MAAVKFRHDYPVFKARAFVVPSWIHGPFELLRATVKWLFVIRLRDNPNREIKDNSTFFKKAAVSHKLGFWSGKPIYKRPKWISMVVRWLVAWFVVVNIKSLLVFAFNFVSSLVQFIHANIAYMWDHRWYFPVFLVLISLVICCYIVVSNMIVARVRLLQDRHSNSATAFSLVLSTHNWVLSKLRKS